MKPKSTANWGVRRMDTWDTWLEPLQKMMADKREREMKGLEEEPDTMDHGEGFYCRKMSDLPRLRITREEAAQRLANRKQIPVEELMRQEDAEEQISWEQTRAYFLGEGWNVIV